LAGDRLPPPTADALVNKLVQKGILTDQEGKDIIGRIHPHQSHQRLEMEISDAVKNIQLFGDLRMRYEYVARRMPGRDGR